LAFWERSLAKLAQNLITFLVVKQILLNLFEYLQYKLITGYQIIKIDNHYKKKIAENPDNAD